MDGFDCDKENIPDRGLGRKTCKKQCHSSMLVDCADMPCVVDVRITSRKGGVRLSLSNSKSISGDGRRVQKLHTAHISKNQYDVLTNISSQLNAALTAVENSKQLTTLKKPIINILKTPVTTTRVCKRRGLGAVGISKASVLPFKKRKVKSTQTDVSKKNNSVEAQNTTPNLLVESKNDIPQKNNCWQTIAENSKPSSIDMSVLSNK